MPSEKSLANLRPWKPGQSGNPKGRSERPSFESLVAKILDERLDDEASHTKREELARLFVGELLDKRIALVREFLAREWPVRHQIEALIGDMGSDDIRDRLLGKLSEADEADRSNGVDREPGPG